MEKRYSVREFAEKVGAKIATVQSWDNRGVLKAKRTITNRRYYTDEDIETVRKGR